MIGSRLGPYLVLERLGGGAMGTVYLASRDGERVALKIIHSHLLERPGFFKRFQREAEMGMLVDHPNVVRTLDCDLLVVEGKPCHFLVMEYVRGRTLHDSLKESGPAPEALLREIGRQVAAGLTAIHARGIVHRDLKPENVLITDRDEVKIMDLGIALLRGEALRASTSDDFAGTILYAAPEQYGGRRKVDARADLYSLGLVLYELAAGRHPFVGDDLPGIIERKSRGEIPRLGAATSGVSPLLEDVVHTLLAPRREQRFPSAEALLDVLREGEQSRWWLDRRRAAERRPRARSCRIPVARETGLHGREPELAALARLFEDCTAGRGRVALVLGEAGVGKTRLVDELVARLETTGRDANVLYGAYPPGGAATAAGALCTAYREFLGAPDLEAELAWRLSDAPGLVVPFAALLRGLPPPHHQPALDWDGTQTAFARVTRALAAERPTIVVIEDLHLAPPEGRALLAALAWAVPGHRILLLATSRPTLPDAWVSDLLRLDHVTRLTLDRLGPEPVRDLLAELLRSTNLAEEIGPRVTRWSDGNPELVIEIFRGLAAEGFLRRAEDGAWALEKDLAGFAIPSSLQEILMSRFAGLEEEERAILDVAACAGYEFDPVLVGDALGLGAIATLRRLARLERAQRLVRAVGDRFAFDHHLLRDCLHDGLSPALREGYHAALAEALERQLGAADRDPRALEGDAPVTLCDHFLRGELSGRALRYLETALDHLETNGLTASALDLAERALAVPDLLLAAARVRVLLRTVTFRTVLGRSDEESGEALDEAARIVRAVPEPGLRLRTRRLVAVHALAAGRRDEAEKALEGIVETARREDVAEEEAAATILLGNLLADSGRYEEARERYERASALAEDAGSRREVARAIGNLGYVLDEQGRLEEALEHGQRCLALFRETGDRLGEVKARGLLGAVHLEAGRWEEARVALEEQRTLARAIGYRRGEARATGNLGIVHLQAGRLREARECYEWELAVARRTGDRAGEALDVGRLGNLHLALGQGAAARERWREALALHREAGDRRGEGFAHQGLARAAELLGDREEALRMARAAVELRREIGHRDGLAASLGLHGRLLLETGEIAEARESLLEASEIGRETDHPEAWLLARAYLGWLGEGWPAEVAADLERAEERLDGEAYIEILHALWRWTGDPGYRESARERIDRRGASLSPADRETLRTGVPLNREILGPGA